MREVVLDTETTGFDPQSGDRIVEIGCIELIGHIATENTYHQYINPERHMPEEAFGVHAIGPDILEPPRPAKPGEVTVLDKPKFAEVGQAFLDFVGDSKLIIHNASFDMKFLNAELKWMGLPTLPLDQAIDTLAIARKKFPGAPASLDALCRRFGVDNSSREKHGALLDSEILAEVYLELIGGRQPDFGLATESQPATQDEGPITSVAKSRPEPLKPRISDEEAAEHKKFVESLGSDAVWTRFSGP